MKLALLACPVVTEYLPTVLPALFATNRVLPNTATPSGPLSPVMKLALLARPVVTEYLPTVLPP